MDKFRGRRNFNLRKLVKLEDEEIDDREEVLKNMRRWRRESFFFLERRLCFSFFEILASFVLVSMLEGVFGVGFLCQRVFGL